MKKILFFGVLTMSLLLAGNLALAQNCTSVSASATADFKGKIDNNASYFQNWTSEVKPGAPASFQYCPPSPAIQTLVAYYTGEGDSLKQCVYSFTFVNNVAAITVDSSSTGNCTVAQPSAQNPAWTITMSVN